MSCPRTRGAVSDVCAVETPGHPVGNAGADRCVTLLATAVSPFRGLCRSSAAGARCGCWPDCHGKEGVAGSSPAEGFGNRATVRFSHFQSGSGDHFQDERKGRRCGSNEAASANDDGARVARAGHAGARSARVPDGYRSVEDGLNSCLVARTLDRQPHLRRHDGRALAYHGSVATISRFCGACAAGREHARREYHPAPPAISAAPLA